MVTYGDCRIDLTLQPVSGKALPVYQGEFLRITQVEGEQCVDFNCFNLHDYKEFMDAAHMRREGFRTREGRILWSNTPRYYPMMDILHMPETCVTDVLGARCNAMLFEYQYGIDDHPNCQDTLAESIGEYGLTPDDVHDSLNLWMNTEWDHIGSYSVWNTGRKGDHVDLLALMDVLAVPAVCGSGNLWVTSNFSYKPIQVQVFEASAETSALAQDLFEKNTVLRTQQRPADFHVKEIRTERELRPTPGYKPQFLNYPITLREIEVALSSEDYLALQQLVGFLGSTDEEVVRTVFYLWYIDNRKKQGMRHWGA